MEHIYVEFSSTAKPFLPFCLLIRLHQLLISFCLWFWKQEKWNCCWLSFFIDKAVTSAITTKSCTLFTESVDCSFYYYWKSLRFLALESDNATQVSFTKAWGNTWRASSFLQKLRKLKGLIDFHIAFITYYNLVLSAINSRILCMVCETLQRSKLFLLCASYLCYVKFYFHYIFYI